MKELWVEKYRPNTIDGYVFRDTHQREQIESWIKQGSIPHLLFSGNAGIGKTTLAKILLNELEINDLDILEINASRTNSVEDTLIALSLLYIHDVKDFTLNERILLSLPLVLLQYLLAKKLISTWIRLTRS